MIYPYIYIFPIEYYIRSPNVQCVFTHATLTMAPFLVVEQHPHTESPVWVGWSQNIQLKQPIGSSVFIKIYPLVNKQKTIENGHRNSGCSHQKWWFSIVMLVYIFTLYVLYGTMKSIWDKYDLWNQYQYHSYGYISLLHIIYIYSINIHMISPNLHVFRKKSAFLTAISYLVRGFNPSEKY